MIETTDDLGNGITHTASREYDLVGRVKASVDEEGNETTYEYDAFSRLVKTSDAFYYTYDALNRLVKVTDPAAGETAYTYDDRDNLIALTDAENQTTRFEYDANNRLEEIRYFTDAGDMAAAKTVTFTYDKVGNLTGYDDGTTSAVYTYDTLYRKTAETVNYGTFSLTNGYTYYDNGLKKTYTGPDAIAYGYLYDANNQLAAVQIPDAGYVTIGEYKWNRPAAMLLPGGSSREFDYDPPMRIKQITANDPAANPVLNYAYAYDRNMIEKSAGGVVTKFFYNLEDRLERVEDGSGNVIAEYYYDPFGRRLWKDVSGARTCFHYCDEGLVGEYDATGAVIKTYCYKPGSTWSTDPLFMKIGAAYYYYHNDHIGIPQKMTSVSGAMVWSAVYDSFGKATIDTGVVTNNLRFAGQYFDGESGLHYNLLSLWK